MDMIKPRKIPRLRPERRQWHIDRGIPLALIVLLIMQLAGGVWWAATITEKVSAMKVCK
jgi:hypothetical protein